MNDEVTDDEKLLIASRPTGRHSLSAMLGDPDLARGISLLVQPTGSRSWVLRFTHEGRRIETGLGGWPLVSMTAAIKEARRVKGEVFFGHLADLGPPDDLVSPEVPEPTEEAVTRLRELLSPDASAGLTFAQASRGAAKLAAKKTRHPEHTERKWASDIDRHCSALLYLPVRQITRAQVIAVVNAVASHAPTMAKRVRGLIRRSIDFARAQDERIGANPADSGIDPALDFQGHKTTHHRALRAEDTPAALDRVAEERGRWPHTGLALRLLTLTATRSQEAREARWSEIDTEARVWTIPAGRMKMGREHRVPLSTQALEVLAEARKLDDGSGWVFPSPIKPGNPITHKCMREAMLICDLKGTPHGMRSSFADWAAEIGWPDRVIDRALAHADDKVRSAYTRTDLLDERRRLMQAWGDFIGTGPARP